MSREPKPRRTFQWGRKAHDRNENERHDQKIQYTQAFSYQTHNSIVLGSQIVSQQETTDRCKASENEFRQKMIELERDNTALKTKQMAISADMTSQYKRMQEQLNGEITGFRAENERLQETISNNERNRKVWVWLGWMETAQKDAAYEELKKEKDLILLKKDEQIRDLQRKIDEMSSEFARMLKETLEKMQDRVELQQWDNESEEKMVKKFKEIAGINS